MNPRASIPTTLSTLPLPKWTTIRSTMVEKAIGSARTGVMSLKTMPGSGKSGTSRISALICSISTALPPFALRRWASLLTRARPPASAALLRGRAPRRGVGRDRHLGSIGRRDPGRPWALRARPARDPLRRPLGHLPALEDHERRGSDEDRRVGADRDPDEHREREVLQRLAAEQQQ